MKIKSFFLILCLVPVALYAADRNSGRVGMVIRTPGMISKNTATTSNSKREAISIKIAEKESVDDEIPGVNEDAIGDSSSFDCRDAYRSCMDEFCLLDESEGQRCACSDNINKSKSLIQEIQKIQDEADKLYTEGVEREQLGAKARLVFGESDAAKKSSKVSGISFADWLGGKNGSGDLGDDENIGDGLYSMAADYCAVELEKCGERAEMEESLYSRLIVADCKSFETYLSDQKRDAESNKRIAEQAVRKARLEMLDTTNKYNRGECLLAYRSCVADKGGCGVNFENCLDDGLLTRRANACENVLDQCMAVRNEVLSDWKDESVSILADAEKYADRNMRATCLAKIQNCLEENCSVSTNSACLTDVNVAAGICPVITECNEKISGLQTVINNKLGYLQTKFCENDIDACLKDKCGVDFTKPECVGKKTSEIVALCPQDMFPSCKNETQFDIIVQSAVLQMDYQILQGCINQFSEKLGTVCGMDMACLDTDDNIMALDKLPSGDTEMLELRQKIRQNSKNAVDEFFVQFENDTTITACKDIQGTSKVKLKGKTSMNDAVFNTAKMIAYVNAEKRSMRELDSKIAELTRLEDIETARKTCEETFSPETPDKSSKNYSYIRSVVFEPELRNCHICRMQQVCETGGEKKSTSALKAAAGGLSAGASAGTMVSPGWGTAIGAVVGAVGAGVMGAVSGGKEDFCQELESCEDVRM
ncbi:MAG: hypothetical protein ACLRFI_01835 [Alphaproteobacteria bacterium]